METTQWTRYAQWQRQIGRWAMQNPFDSPSAGGILHRFGFRSVVRERLFAEAIRQSCHRCAPLVAGHVETTETNFDNLPRFLDTHLIAPASYGCLRCGIQILRDSKWSGTVVR